MPSERILAIKSVSLRFGDVWALRNVSLELAPGETYVFFGAAGSGKTSLLKAAVGLVRVDSGVVQLFGEDITRMREHAMYGLRAHVGVLFQEGGLFDSFTVGENVEYPLLNQQKAGAGQDGTASTEAKVREALRFVELEGTSGKLPSEISGGMRRRVGIARAIVTNPPLVLYDSPTAGLDPITANTIMALVAKQRDLQNTASLVVSHRYQDGEIMDEFRYDRERGQLLRMSDEERQSKVTNFVVMREGEIAFRGTREQLEASPDSYVKRFVKHEEQ